MFFNLSNINRPNLKQPYLLTQKSNAIMVGQSRKNMFWTWNPPRLVLFSHAMDDFKFEFKFICCSDHKQHQFLHLFAYQPKFK